MIRNKCTIAASDASIARNLLSTHWIFPTLENDIEIEGRVDFENWTEGMISSGEAIETLDLIQYIIARSTNIESDEVVVFIDNKTILKEMYKPINKESNITSEAGATVAIIQDLISNVTIDISAEYANNKYKPEKTFQQ